MIIVLVGKSASGKTKIAELLTENYRYDKITTATTRPKRPNEIEDVSYYFLTDEEFIKQENEGMFIETAIFNNWHYGTYSDSFAKDGDYCIVLNPSGLRALKSNKKLSSNVYSVFLDADDYVRMQRQMIRGDAIGEVERRFKTDEEDFAGIENYVDLTIDNSGNEPEQCVIKILENISVKEG